MKEMSLFEEDSSRLHGGFIIPPFIMNDPYLDDEKKIRLSVLLHFHLQDGKEINLSFTPCNNSGCDCLMNWRTLYDSLEDMNYINVVSKKQTKKVFKYNVVINSWYLQYIDKNPDYWDYQEDYCQFLLRDILPTLKDKKNQDKLCNGILDSARNEYYRNKSP